MARPLSVAKQATFRHAKVIFSPFGCEPGGPKVLTSDPWSYLRTHLVERKVRSRGENKIRATRSLYFLELAEEFCRSAAQTRLPAKATLTYYSVLNLVKCFCCIRGQTLGDRSEHHGLTPSTQHEHGVKVSQRPRNHNSVFHSFAVSLNKQMPNQEEVDFAECLSHIPELHELAFKIGILKNNQRQLLPVKIAILTDDSESWLLSEVSYIKKQVNLVPTNRFLSGPRESYFGESREEQDSIIHRCKRRKSFDWRTFPRLYSNICNEYSSHDISPLLGREGYRYYCDLSFPKYSHLQYAFMALFYIGTTSRYSPAKTEELLNGKFTPVISELLTLTPSQFLYQLTSHITSNMCVVPYAKL